MLSKAAAVSSIIIWPCTSASCLCSTAGGSASADTATKPTGLLSRNASTRCSDLQQWVLAAARRDARGKPLVLQGMPKLASSPSPDVLQRLPSALCHCHDRLGRRHQAGAVEIITQVAVYGFSRRAEDHEVLGSLLSLRHRHVASPERAIVQIGVSRIVSHLSVLVCQFG